MRRSAARAGWRLVLAAVLVNFPARGELWFRCLGYQLENILKFVDRGSALKEN